MSFSEEKARLREGLLRLVDAGVSVREAAESLGVSTGSAYSMLRGAGRLSGMAKTVITEAHRARVIEVFDGGGSVNQAASASMLSFATARRILVAAGRVSAEPRARGKAEARARGNAAQRGSTRTVGALSYRARVVGRRLIFPRAIALQAALEPEAQEWLERLPTDQFATVAFYVDLLAEDGPLLGEPYTRQLDGKLRELRFHLDRQSVRVTYWIANGRRIVLLTVFVKNRMREAREVERDGERCRNALPRNTRWRRTRHMTERTSWKELRDRRMEESGAQEAYNAARLAYELGRTVRGLREQRGWSQTELAKAAAMTQSAVARFEAGGTVPSLPVLERIARALDADLTVQVTPRTAAV